MYGQYPGIPGLLGGYQPYGGLLGTPQASTQNLMAQYLQNLFMRRYSPPALTGAENTVRSQMGPGGMQYQAPVPTAQTLPSAAQVPAAPVANADPQFTQMSASYAPWAAAYRGGQ